MSTRQPDPPDLLKAAADEVTPDPEERLERDGERLFPASFAASGTPLEPAIVDSVSISADHEE